jgi:hypothetical protein
MAYIDLQQPASPVSALAWGTLVIGGIFAVIDDRVSGARPREVGLVLQCSEYETTR